MINAEIVADSKNPWGQRITTFVLTFPRIVLAEFNTHRMISRNSASSRAIPTHTMIDNLVKNTFKPIRWLKEHPGMQGFDYWEEDSPEAIAASIIWSDTRYNNIQQAKALLDCEVSKQFINRLLEPFMWHTVVATATEWENFFALRAHPMAEIHIQDLAFKMLEEYNKSEPQVLSPGQWHIPFKDKMDVRAIEDWTIENETDKACYAHTQLTLAKISAAICAGVSYGRIKDVTNIEDMLDLHDSLILRPFVSKFHRGTRSEIDPIHTSPTEHQAECMNEDEFKFHSDVKFVGGYINIHKQTGWDGNFRGFKQYRKMLANENALDSRVIKK